MSAGSSSLFAFAFYYAICIFLLLNIAQTQSQTPASTDPSEVGALNTVFETWGIKALDLWNISGEPCSGAAINLAIPIYDFNPFIKCNCSYNNGSTCHITQLRVYQLNVKGEIPKELWSLTFLIYLDLGLNYLTGKLSASLGNLILMQQLYINSNAFFGEFPKEVGNLTDLTSLSFAENNFSGSLPMEMGRLLKLKELYFSSSGVSGHMPQTFAQLQNMEIMWAVDVELVGKIPEYIGNWLKLKNLRLQGNSFDGPIPLTFTNLTALEELRISDISNGISSLAFIKEMKSLKKLELRNNLISDSLPPHINDYRNLNHLDLSFNNISGPIPESLFNSSSLKYLFLGNNTLTGSLPFQKVASLQNIDLSYNNLVGNFPPRVNEKDLQINLVANNFTIRSSDNSVLLSGLNCLQRNFPCYRGRGIYYNFGIKCGGPQITSSTGIVYERDNETLGPATYYVTNTKRWAVSNVGYFTDIDSPQYISSSSSQFTNTLDSELFQTSRLSASSLRYYGLGLENGNYTVTLQFAETTFMDSNRWESLGRRVFNIYIQGYLVQKDFDIRKEAIQKKFKVRVSENYLEIHLFWAGKGTCCIPAKGTYGPSISAISATPDFTPTVDNKPPSSKNNGTGLIVGIVVGTGVVSFLSVFLVFYIFQRRKQSQSNDDEEHLGRDARTFTFSYAELKTATDGFNPANKLGEGGFGPVYKGTLNDGRVIAVKKLSVTSHQGKNQFVTEIATISAVQHRNLVKLYGCCIKGDKRLLVYEYLENRSLDQALFGKRSLNLEWPTRYGICLGVARGLAYLHEESRLRIVHRDVKASNILLDSDLIPKISDFGLAKLYDDKKTHISTCVAGTIGYLAPEYAMRGYLTEKADVFSFGIVALEIISGRPNSDSSLEEEKIYLLEWAWHLHENNCEVDLVDSNLSEFNEEEVKRVIGVSLLCTRTSPTLRPSMSRVVAMLSGDIEVSAVTSRPGYLTDWKFDSKETDTSFYNSSASTSMMGGAENSPINAAKPMLPKTVKEGW